MVKQEEDEKKKIMLKRLSNWFSLNVSKWKKKKMFSCFHDENRENNKHSFGEIIQQKHFIQIKIADNRHSIVDKYQIKSIHKWSLDGTTNRIEWNNNKKKNEMKMMINNRQNVN